ncbi:MAG TPA: helix-turn-helix domain-containing protein [Burkholderiaceae bacterium]|nr:helix-turn-helix domain-containing protein [Burkholderiaceae bacterium]
MRKKISLTPDSTRCSTCMLSGLCLPIGISPDDVAQLDEVVSERLRIKRGGVLYQQGDEANAIYGIRSGTLKTQLNESSGAVQITGFLLAGEIAGIDGFLNGTQLSSAVALEDTEVCVARIDDIDQTIAKLPQLRNQLRRITNLEVQRSHQLIISLGVLRAEQRLAAFLMSMSQKLQALGYSPTHFILRMSREEIGNYLGLTLETVSRLFSRFAREKLINVKQREIELLDIDELQALSMPPE